MIVFLEEPGRTMIEINNKLYIVYSTSHGNLSGDMYTTPLCAEITPGIVSLSFSDRAGYTVTGDKFFKRMGAAPFFFAVNVDPYDMLTHPGVCSLKVEWFC